MRHRATMKFKERRLIPRIGKRGGGTDFRALFEAVPDPCLVLDRKLTIVAVNEAYLKTTMTTRNYLVGGSLFEVFPDNPDDPTASGVRNLRDSLERVFKNGKSDTLPVQKYDIRRPEREGGNFEVRYWSAVNAPVFGAGGAVTHIIHHVQDVTEFVLQQPATLQWLGEPAQVSQLMDIFARSQELARVNSELERSVTALRESQRLFGAFMEHLPAAAWMKDMEGRYVFANAETERLFSIPIAVLLGKRSEEVFPPDIADKFFDIDRKVLEHDGNGTPVEVVRETGGAQRHLLVSKFVIRDAAGGTEFIAGVAIDTTEVKRMEAEIERLASFPLVNPNPVLEFSLDGRVTFCNPAASTLLEQEGCGADHNPFVPDDLSSIIQQLQEGQTQQYAREVTVDGRIFEESFVLLAQQNSVRCYTMEITKRRRVERERERLLLQMQAVLENINEGVVISDPEGYVLTMNKEALALHEYADVEEVRRHFSRFQERFELYDAKGELLPLQDWPLMRALRGERFFDYELRLHSNNSGRTWFASYNGTPIGDASGKAILAVVTVRDISHRKELEEEIRSLNAALATRVAQLEETNQELEAFNRMVSHDLRQPLNTIGTSCQAMEMLCQLDEECQKYLRISYNKVLVMNDLIESLLKFSRSTHSELKHERVDLSRLAREVFADIQVAEPERKVCFVAAEGAVADGDPYLLRSVLENLIGNAWKYTSMREKAEIEFGMQQFEEGTAFFVRDNGGGFKPEEAEQLFTPFRRLAGAEKFSGFGIGLATVERIVKRHGGEVCADGEPGKGAIFYFTLPRDQVRPGRKAA